MKYLISMILISLLIYGDTDKKREDVTVRIPFMFYSSDTGLGGVLYYKNIKYRGDFRRDNDIVAMLTSEGQQQIMYINSLEDLNKGLTYDYALAYMNWSSSYYGIGLDNEDGIEEGYDLKQVRASLGIRKNFGLNSSLKGSYRLYTNKIDGIADDVFSGDRDTLISGIGINYSFDRVDSRVNPKNGYRLNFSSEWYNSIFSSDLDFQKNSFDLKAYKELNERSLLAFQYSIESSSGDIPFYEMYSLGSSMMIRGYLAGRHIDKNFTAMQGEYKYYLNNKWVASVFGGVGTISSSLGDLYSSDMKKAVGVGLRYIFSEEENVKMRFDIGFSEDGDVAVYILFAEAL